MVKVTKELQTLLEQDSTIKNVYFNKEGRHFLNTFMLPEKKGDTELNRYGTGLFSHKQLIPGDFNVDKITEDISIGDPSSLIEDERTRKEILSAKPISSNAEDTNEELKERISKLEKMLESLTEKKVPAATTPSAQKK